MLETTRPIPRAYDYVQAEPALMLAVTRHKEIDESTRIAPTSRPSFRCHTAATRARDRDAAGVRALQKPQSTGAVLVISAGGVFGVVVPGR